MAYRLEADEGLGTGIKRLVLEQVDDALDQLTHTPEGQDEAVYDARKRFKKVRAALRLVRDEIGEDIYKRENICYRDVGRQLSKVRDSQVNTESLTGLMAKCDDLSDGVYAELRDKLIAEHVMLRRKLLDEEGLLTVIATTILEARRRVVTWPIEHDDFSAIAKGLKRVYKRGRKGLARTAEYPTSENFHDWRKRAKYLWYHSRILELLWPAMFGELEDETHTLSNHLGDSHDLHELSQWLLDRPELFAHERDKVVLFADIRQRQSELRRAARLIGNRVYAEDPKVFVARIGEYWQIARV